MPSQYFKKVVFLGFLFCLIAACVAVFKRQTLFAMAVGVSSLWMFVNGYFLMRLVAIGMNAAQAPKNKILVLSLLKFPVLYGTGFFILKTRFFPVEGILTGLSLFFLAFAVVWGMNIKKIASGGIAGLLFFAAKAYASEGGEAHGHGEAGLHTTNLISFIARYLPERAAEFLTGIENIFFGVLVIVILAVVFYLASRDIRMVPGRLQSACEAVVAWLNDFVCGILGPEGRKYTPFLGTLFLYILTMNLIGLVPLMKSNTANSITLKGPVALPVPTTTVALALIVFVTVQAIGIRKQGFLGYLDHMAGSPRDAFGWTMAPLMFPIHLIGEFAKPFSLTFRLFCNTMGGHILVAVFIGMGVTSMLIPFQAPFLMFEIVTSTIQAFVFTLLSTVYIAMMLPHGHEKHEPVSGHTHEAAH